MIATPSISKRTGCCVEASELAATGAAIEESAAARAVPSEAGDAFVVCNCPSARGAAVAKDIDSGAISGSGEMSGDGVSSVGSAGRTPSETLAGIEVGVRFALR